MRTAHIPTSSVHNQLDTHLCLKSLLMDKLTQNLREEQILQSMADLEEWVKSKNNLKIILKLEVLDPQDLALIVETLKSMLRMRRDLSMRRYQSKRARIHCKQR